MEMVTLDYCKENFTKPQGRGWKCVCPACGGNDLWATVDTGSVYCFNCAFRARIADAEVSYTKADPLDIPSIRSLYTDLSHLYQDTLTDSAVTYLTARGITEDMVQTFSIGYCQDVPYAVYRSSIAKDAGISRPQDGSPFLKDRIVFPYIADGAVTDLRGRAIDSAERLRYKSPYNSAVARGAIFPFNFDRAIKRAYETGILIITEGEIKTMFADAAGFACVGLPGMTNWRQGLALDPKICPIVVFDNSVNPEDRMRIDRAIAHVGSKVYGLHVATLPLLGKSKQDIDSYLLDIHGGPQRFERIIGDAVPFDLYRKLRRF